MPILAQISILAELLPGHRERQQGLKSGSSMVPDAIPFASLRRVLVIKLRHHGDVLLTSPVFSTLQASCAQSGSRCAGLCRHRADAARAPGHHAASLHRPRLETTRVAGPGPGRTGPAVDPARPRLRSGHPPHRAPARRLAGPADRPPLVGGAAAERRVLEEELQPFLPALQPSPAPYRRVEPRCPAPPGPAADRRRQAPDAGPRPGRRSPRRGLAGAPPACRRRLRPLPPRLALAVQMLAGEQGGAAGGRPRRARPRRGADLGAGPERARADRRHPRARRAVRWSICPASST